jgi:HEPN domain-containing protein
MEDYLEQELDWNAETKPVILLVELPFWLMVSNTTQTVTLNDFEYKVQIFDNFYELHGTEFYDSRGTCAYIGPIEKVDQNIIHEAKNQNINLIWRKCKTVLKIHSLCNEDIFKIKGSKHESIARVYLKTLCEAHIAIINILIQQYRLATYDYFPFEISPWTAPFWWVTQTNKDGFRLTLLEYKNWDFKPMFTNIDLRENIYTLISPFQLQQSLLNFEPSPGEYDLLDALNLMERGDYNGAVIRITTAIEVLVEDLLLTKLNGDFAEKEVERIAKSLKNNFPKKLKKYLEVSGRTLDIWIEKELPEIRNLRHTIVHSAYRVHYNNRGLAQEKVDKGRWIYNWFENKSDRRDRREKLIGLRSLGRSVPPIFNYNYTNKAVVIEKPSYL